jgi:hypothetical protein
MPPKSRLRVVAAVMVLMSCGQEREAVQAPGNAATRLPAHETAPIAPSVDSGFAGDWVSWDPLFPEASIHLTLTGAGGNQLKGRLRTGSITSGVRQNRWGARTSRHARSQRLHRTELSGRH